MPSKKAKDHYLGKNDRKRLNCAQSVLAGFDESDPKIGKFLGHGSGNAPDGWCGAASAALEMTGDRALVEKTFNELAGSVKCKEIRMNRKLSCPGCVEAGAKIVEDHKRPKNS